MVGLFFTYGCSCDELHNVWVTGQLFLHTTQRQELTCWLERVMQCDLCEKNIHITYNNYERHIKKQVVSLKSELCFATKIMHNEREEEEKWV